MACIYGDFGWSNNYFWAIWQSLKVSLDYLKDSETKLILEWNIRNYSSYSPEKL